jgi:choline transport protein
VFAPKSLRKFLSYTSGWMTTIAWQHIIAADCYIIADIVQALIEVNHPDYAPTRWSSTLLIIAAVIVVTAFDIFAAGHLRVAEGAFATCRSFAFVPIVVTLWVMVVPKMSAVEVFARFSDYTGSWPTAPLSALIGQTTGVFTNCRSDALAYMAEEVQDPAVAIPLAMFWSYILAWNHPFRV